MIKIELKDKKLKNDPEAVKWIKDANGALNGEAIDLGMIPSIKELNGILKSKLYE